MKICVLFGGHKKKGNTATLLEAVLTGAKEKGHEIERLNLVDLEIKPCLGCMACKKEGATGCIQNDDMPKVVDAVVAADLLIFASPMYWWNVTGPLKTTIDRFFALPFVAATGQSAFAKKKLLLVMTSGQPAMRDGREGLAMIFSKMCSFTGMEWLGIISTGTNDQPMQEQTEVISKARAFGASL